MGTDRNTGEGQTRVDWMIEEFRKAQSRRRVKAPADLPESRGETAGNVAADESVTDARPLIDDKAL